MLRSPTSEGCWLSMSPVSLSFSAGIYPLEAEDKVTGARQVPRATCQALSSLDKATEYELGEMCEIQSPHPEELMV